MRNRFALSFSAFVFALAFSITVAAQTKDQPDLETLVQMGDGAAMCAAAKTAALSRRLDRSAARSAYSIASINTDMTYYHLDLDIDLVAEHIDGVVRVEGTVVGSALSTLLLDLKSNMVVDSVQLSDGTPLSYSQGVDALIITMPAPVSVGGAFEIDVWYGGTPLSAGFGYFVFGTKNGDLYAWSLSEPYGSRNWWPCKDHPFDKADSVRVTVTVPSQYKVGSQGTLVSTTVAGPNTTYDWLSHYPISTYLVSVAVGEYVEYLGTYNRLPDLALQYGALSMPLRHLVYDDGSSGLWSNWAMVGDMIDAFEHWFGPYPFANEKYGHAECTFGGGMEHQTMTSMGASSSISLASHELAHMWYGDAISPKSWPHLWLNEGFATYGELVYWEARSSTYPGWFESNRISKYNSAKSASGTLVVQDTTTVNNLFTYSRVYAKGATVLHMLRTVVGDATFKDILREYTLDPAVQYGVAETADFQRVAETESGMDLDQFFSQWVTEGTGYPTYRMSANWHVAPGGGYTVYVVVEQTQIMPQSNINVFEMPLTIAVQTLSGEERFVVQNDERMQMFELSVTAEPTSVAVDPDVVVLRSGTIATGIGNTPQASMLTIESLTPNPARNSLAIQFGTGDASEIAIDVYDVAGRRVLSRSVTSSPAGVQFQTLNTSALATGVYFLRIRGYEGQVTRKFVVLR